VRFVAFWLADEATRTLTLASSSDPAIAGDWPRRTMPYEMGATGWVARHRERVVIDDITGDPRIMDGEWLARQGLTSYMAYPIVSGDELLAIVALLHSAPIACPTTPSTSSTCSWAGERGRAQRAALPRGAAPADVARRSRASPAS